MGEKKITLGKSLHRLVGLATTKIHSGLLLVLVKQFILKPFFLTPFVANDPFVQTGAVNPFLMGHSSITSSNTATAPLTTPTRTTPKPPPPTTAQHPPHPSGQTAPVSRPQPYPERLQDNPTRREAMDERRKRKQQKPPGTEKRRSGRREAADGGC